MRGLDRLLRPRTIAVIGGGAWCANVIEQCQKIGFTGEIWPVHPSRDTVAGVAAFADVDSLPAAPDAAFIGVNRDATIDAVARLSARGAGGAICFASGFRESQEETGDGAVKQAELLAAADGMKIIGPNCYGLLNYLDGVALWPDQHGGEAVETGVAVITQSSNIAINLTMQERGLPIAYVITVGNQAQTGLSEIGVALLQDPRVTALGLHIEGIDDLRGFEEMAATARELGKPITALKTGKSEQARAATISHTASLAGSDAGAHALLARLGIGRVTSLSGLLETLKLLHVTGALSSGRIASLSCSGGEASLIADMAHGSGLSFPPLSDAQETGLRAALGAKVALSNPLDYHTYIWNDGAALERTFSAMMTEDLALGIVVLDFPRADRCSAEAWQPVINAVAGTQAATGRPMAILSSLGEAMPESVAQELVRLGIVPLSGMTEAIEAIDVAARIGRSRPAPEALLLPRNRTGARTLTEAEAKTALAAFGVRIPRAERVAGSDAAASAAMTLGFPVVLKGEGIAHKTEAGAVALALGSAQAVREAAEAMPTDQFLVEEMITDTVAELLVGVVRDPAHGYVLTLAAGGTLTELLEDRVNLLLPSTPEDIRAALNKMKLAKLLDGYRGAPAVHKGAIVDVVMAVQSFVAATHPEEIEINPLLCCTDGAVAADALIITGENHD
ncbi:acetate--CoA ligase family protein [Antarcticimicrobium luteum]|nr:acetate--CoA ligase family protein [Antarcticimicrobium luteum]